MTRFCSYHNATMQSDPRGPVTATGLSRSPKPESARALFDRIRAFGERPIVIALASYLPRKWAAEIPVCT
jgi:hypothetical protein